MRVAREYGLMHSEFLKKDKIDRDKAIWLYLDDLAKCNGCGTRREEWLDEEGKLIRTNSQEKPYDAKPQVCGGCRELEIEQLKFQKEFEKNQAATRGAKFRMVPREE